jgi:hypothetical protein
MSTEAQLPIDLYEAGRRARLIDDRYRNAHDLFVRSLEAAWLQDDRRTGARALLALANNLVCYCPAEIENLDLESTDDLCMEALALFQQVGDESGVADCLRALDRIEESLEVCRRIKYQPGIVQGLARQAILSGLSGRVGASEDALAAVELARELDEPRLLADALRTAAICLPQEETSFSRQLWLEAASIYRELNLAGNCAAAKRSCAFLACDDDPDLQERLLEEAGDLWHSLERYESERICLERIAELADNRGDTVRAAQCRERTAFLDSLSEPD